MHAIIYLGHTAFPISTRNSVTAVVHLLANTMTEQIIVSCEEPIQKVIDEADALIRGQPGQQRGLKVIQVPMFGDLFPEHQHRVSPDYLETPKISRPKRPAMTEPALILHSSGSTGLPKLVTITQEGCLVWIRTPWFGGHDICGSIMGVLSLPPFHAGGVSCYNWFTFGSGAVLATFNPTIPPAPPSPGAVLQGLKGTKSSWAMLVPMFLEVRFYAPLGVARC
ncbi:hypothetical protein FRB94_004591 [Tulasnella sp. JGI-2019a]|nr:hypothetical protein FRB94_004591 [Tulasnella sp. JGI-2019a]